MTGVSFEPASARSRAIGTKRSSITQRAQQRFVKHMRWKWRTEHVLDKLVVPNELERQQQFGPIRHVYRQAELFAPAHEGDSETSSLLSLSQQYEQIHWTLE